MYLRSIESALAAGKSALLLVPEIALTPAMAGQFFHRFGKQVAILHSAISGSERADQWRRIRTGRARVVVGTRSGVFAPVQDLGLLIVDEEHDGSYKQQDVPRYHGRDVAIVRAKELGAVAFSDPPHRVLKPVITPTRTGTRCFGCRSALLNVPCRRSRS